MQMTATSDRQYGLLLPHFGTHASRDSLLRTARTAEQLGFHSVWVRDHVVYQPHEHEDPSPVHLDPFITLAAVAALTDRLILGSAVLIPHRHPIQTAVLLGSLAALAGPGRVIAGWGVGTYNHEFEAVGIGDLDRRELVQEHVEVIRQLLTGAKVSRRSAFYKFNDVSIAPVPPPGYSIPMYYGGSSKAAVRRAAEYCDGYIASRTPSHPLSLLLERMRTIAADRGRPVPRVVAIPYVVPGDSMRDAEQYLNLPALLEDSRRHFEPAPGESFETLADLDGAVLAGSPEDIAAGANRLHDLGVQHIVFDLRPVFDRLDQCVAVIGNEVLPKLQRQVLSQPVTAGERLGSNKGR
jgi:alkanesulfonate monooxygenase SsuD/methylene tetrahydromethanopterin reductase-like flavin-dependent oxidoreductase (luciferase family)